MRRQLPMKLTAKASMMLADLRSDSEAIGKWVIVHKEHLVGDTPLFLSCEAAEEVAGRFGIIAEVCIVRV